MTSLACDHSTAGVTIGGSLKRAGLHGVIRYAAEGRGNVNISPREAHDLRANRIPVGIVVEHEADWLLRGSVGRRVAASREITRACGLPDGVSYMAADFDCTNGGPVSSGGVGERNMRGIASALQEAAAVIGPHNVGFYGSYFGIVWLQQHLPWIKWFWQTEAWSMRQRSRAACLFQRAQSINVAGVEVDIDEIWKSSWGQRDHVVKPPPPPPPPRPEGVFKAEVSWNARTGRREIHPLPGEGVKLGEHASVKLEAALDPKTGVWKIH